MSNRSCLTIEEVQQAFLQWRSAKQPGDRIPNALWLQGKQLLEQHETTRILHALSLSSQQLRKHGLLPPLKPKTKQKSKKRAVAPKFADVTTQAFISPPKESRMTLLNDKGLKLIFSNPSDQQIKLVLDICCNFKLCYR